MKTFSDKISPSILSIGIIVVWFTGLHFVVSESTDVLVSGMAYIISTPLVIMLLDYTIE